MELDRYLDALTSRTRRELGSSLVAVTLIGSAGAGWFEPEVSDVDVAVVVGRPLGEASARSLADRLSHSQLPCPARRLELVVYRRDLLAEPAWPLPFELNFNTGEGMADHVGLDPSAEAAHWFLLDLAIARERSTPLAGPPLHALLGDIPRPDVLDALRSALDWYAEEEPDAAASTLAACRAWQFAEEDEWGSKRDAAEWATARLADTGPVHRALTLRGGGTAEFPTHAEAEAVLDRARAAIDAG
jgi:hypothetical protein